MVISIMYYNFNCYLEIIDTFKFERILLTSVNGESCDIFCFAPGSVEQNQQDSEPYSKSLTHWSLIYTDTVKKLFFKFLKND